MSVRGPKRIATDKIEQLLAAGREQLSDEEYERLKSLIVNHCPLKQAACPYPTPRGKGETIRQLTLTHRKEMYSNRQGTYPVCYGMLGGRH